MAIPTDTTDRKRILVGVTDIFFYTKVRDALRARGYELDRARDQRELVEKAGASAPAVTILNMNDPDLDAFAALAHLRSQAALARMPILAFANHDEVETWRRAREGGVTKIVSRNEFSARTAQLVDELLVAVTP